MSDTIEPGSLVRLKSGGPLMTVTKVAKNFGQESAWVSWFAGEELFPVNATYPIVALTPALPEAPDRAGF